jgi:hypothetical protein
LSQGLQKLPELTTFIPTSNPSRTLRLTWNFKLPMLLLFAFQLKNVHLRKVGAAGVLRIGDLSVAPCSLLTVQNRKLWSWCVFFTRTGSHRIISAQECRFLALRRRSALSAICAAPCTKKGAVLALTRLAALRHNLLAFTCA